MRVPQVMHADPRHAGALHDGVKVPQTLFGFRMRPLPVQNTRSLSSQNVAARRWNVCRSLCERSAATVAGSRSIVRLAACDFGS